MKFKSIYLAAIFLGASITIILHQFAISGKIFELDQILHHEFFAIMSATFGGVLLWKR